MNQLYRNTEHRIHGLATPYGPQAAARVRAFHESIPGYAMSPLLSLEKLAHRLGLGAFLLKDESPRFGLNSFKSLGGSYCLASVMRDRFGLPEEFTFADILGTDAQARAKMVFVTATDGNHGRGVAWSARMLGAGARVYMPSGSREERVENIRKEGAEVTVTACDYDDTVRMATKAAQEKGWILTQDTAWSGYTDYPARIMQGYQTIGEEILSQTECVPTHIFLQAGVGSMAASLCAYFRKAYGEEVCICVVEATAADCLYQTARAGDGKMHATKGNMQTMMAGLCCGEPCTLAAEILLKQADFFVTVTDDVAATGMRTLARNGDTPVISGESGAATTGLVVRLMEDPQMQEMREAIRLGPDARVLCLSTEGATDRENYAAIVG
ncbi:MAG: diaminopropionate ammonia-lyase [Clostridia bacterium]|nr:diaminopropionate ammonia-lyase [Clostridia bacterium]MBR2288100.1 diaminopropionate ammonia-lyase [Clostridia bacterium]